MPLHDVACVMHLHSTHSDGTGTVPEIAAAGERAGVDAVLLTDHDSLEAKRHGEEGWYGSTLVLVGEEISPPNANHYLAFGLDREISHRGRSAAEICAAVTEAGGFGFAAHPFSRGSERFRRGAGGMPWRDLDATGLGGIELWSFVTDTAERLGSIRDAIRFVARPGAFVDHPPERNLAEWDRLCAERSVTAIGGLDAHQFGVRVAGRVPLRLMAYERSFRYLRTHVLCDDPLSGDAAADRERIYAALRAGRCYIAMDALAPSRGFYLRAEARERAAVMGEEAAFDDGPWRLRARAPHAAELRLLRGGVELARVQGREVEAEAAAPGAYRVEARVVAGGRARTWIISNPVYLR